MTYNDGQSNPQDRHARSATQIVVALAFMFVAGVLLGLAIGAALWWR